jgi:hypothetical protein
MFGVLILLLLCGTGGSLLLVQCLCHALTPVPVGVSLGSARSRSPRAPRQRVHFSSLHT